MWQQLGDVFFGASLSWGALFSLKDSSNERGSFMANTNKPSGSKKSGLSNGLGVALLSMAASKVVEPALEKTINIVADKISNDMNKKRKNEKIIIPELYKKGFPLTKDQAMSALDRCGITAVPIEVSLKEASPRYKDCVDNQVVDSNPKQKRQLDSGGVVYIKYVPHDVIVESQKIFNDEENVKKELEEQKVAKSIERKEKMKVSIESATGKARDNIAKIFKNNTDKE